MHRVLGFALSGLVWVNTAAGQTARSEAASLQGAWRFIEITGSGPNATTNRNPQPGLIIFTPKHYSFTRVTAEFPRKPPANPESPTLAQLSNVAEFASQTGTYEVTTPGEVTFRRVAAFFLNLMEPGSYTTYSFVVQADTMLTLKPLRNQGGPVGAGAVYRLRRVE
jgi:hypothetical protein